MTLAIGIDPGIAHTGFAAFVGVEIRHLDVLITKKHDRVGDTQARLAELLDWAADHLEVLRLLGHRHIDAIVVEWPVVGGRHQGATRANNVASAAQTFAAAGALIGMLRDRSELLLAPVPQSWRAAIAQPGESTDALLARLDETYGVSARLGKGRGAHGTDAVGLALYGQQHLAALAA